MRSVVSGKRLFLYAYRLKPLACFGEFDLDRVLGGLETQHTQKYAGSVRSREFTLPLVGGRRRAVDRLAELRDGSIGSFALGDPLSPNFSGFRGR